MASPLWMLVAVLAMFAQKSLRVGPLAERLVGAFLLLLGLICFTGWLTIPVDQMLWTRIYAVCSSR